MGQMSQEQINVDLFDEVTRLKKVVNSLEEDIEQHIEEKDELRNHVKNQCTMTKLEFNGSYYNNCSECNESYGYAKSFDKTPFNYCPNCGSKIKEWK